jgi:RimJ/RimL family protein N-acetyltransferase
MLQNNISTNRLLLNLLTKEDHEFILQLLNSQGWIEFIGDRNVHSKEEAVAYIDKILASKNLFYWVVRLQGENVPVGIISFIKRPYLDHFDIGFAFLPEHSGCGYAYEAAQKIISIMSGKLNYHPILATTLPCNTKSIKLLNKLGLQFEKELKLENDVIHIYSNAASVL